MKIYVFILIFFAIAASYSQNFTLKIETFESFPGSSFVETVVSPKWNGVPAGIDLDNITIYQANYAIVPLEITPLDAGRQTIKWLPNYEIIAAGDNLAFTIIAVKDGQIASADFSSQNIYPSSIWTFDNKGGQFTEVNFGKVEAGEEKFFLIDARIGQSRYADKVELVVDSVSLDSDEFSFRWVGSVLNKDTIFPITMYGSEPTYISLYFRPKNTELKNALLTFYYDNGSQKHIKLFGGDYPVEPKTDLELIYPNGDEILTPCQVVTVQWKGNVAGKPVKVEFSPDGNDWEEAGQATGNSFQWTVPSEYTGEGMLRISQEFTQDPPVNLKTAQDISRVAYNASGTRILTFGAGGLQEWSGINGALLGTYDLPLAGSQYCAGIAYTKDDEFIYVYNSPAVIGSDEVVYYSSGNSVPSQVLPFKKYRVRDIAVSRFYGLLLMIPERSNILSVIDYNTGSSFEDIACQRPVASAAFHDETDKMIVALADNEVKVMRIDQAAGSVSSLNSFRLTDIPRVNQLALAPNGKYAALGCYAKPPSANGIPGTQTYIVDIDSEKIIMLTREGAVETVGIDFSPSSNLVVIGSEYIPQLVLVDLITREVAGKLDGNNNKLTDIDIATDINSLVYGAAGTAENVKGTFISFTFPEYDLNDKPFSIVAPTFTLSDGDAGEGYIFHDKEASLTKELCNTGPVPIYLNNDSFDPGMHFALAGAITPDTLFPGECLDITVIFNPKDPGTVYDTLVYQSCDRDYRIPLSGTGLDRNLAFINAPFTLEGTCIGDTSRLENIALFVNRDPVPVLINDVRAAPEEKFTVVPESTDKLLQPGDTLFGSVFAHPDVLGDLEGRLTVYHSGQEKYVREERILVRGIGAFVDLSHKTLPFIPEILSRELRIKNTGDDKITLNAVEFTPDNGAYSVPDQFPKEIEPGEETELIVTWDGAYEGEVTLYLIGDPCLVQRYVLLTYYDAASTVDLPDIEADPLDTAVIRVDFTTQENYPYQGIRPFEAEVVMNYKYFYPLRAESEHGQAQIVSSTVDGTNRKMSVRVEGDFPAQGNAFRIYGMPVLADTSSTPMSFDASSQMWGKAVNTSTSFGTFSIKTDWVIIHLDQSLSIKNIYPLPADEEVRIDISSTAETGMASLSVYDIMGNLVGSREIALEKGENTGISTGTDQLPSGIYTVRVALGGKETSATFSVARW